MFSSGRMFSLLAVVLALALIVGVLALVWAQPGAQPGQLQPPGGGRGMGGRPRMGGMMGMMGSMGMNPMMMMQAMAPPAIAVADGKVFVAAAGKLYRFDAKTLELEKQATYANMPAMPGRPGPAPGGAGAAQPQGQ